MNITIENPKTGLKCTLNKESKSITIDLNSHGKELKIHEALGCLEKHLNLNANSAYAWREFLQSLNK